MGLNVVCCIGRLSSIVGVIVSRSVYLAASAYVLSHMVWLRIAGSYCMK